MTGPWTDSDGLGGHFARYARRLDQTLDQLAGPDRRRLERAARRFLSASGVGWPDVSAPPDLSAQLITDYVTVLEALTVDGRGPLAHRTAQHVAVLVAGDDDEQRVETFRFVKRAYDARSSYAHGSDVKDGPDLRELRRLVQRTIVRFIISAAAKTDERQFSHCLPEATLSTRRRRELIDAPCEAWAP